MASVRMTPTLTEIDAPLEPAPERAIPWQIWATALFLGLEGIANLFAIPSDPRNAFWLGMKALFVTGLIRGWKSVYFVYLVTGLYHVVGFGPGHPIPAFLNLILVLLVLSSTSHFFPGHSGSRGVRVHIPQDLAKQPSTRDWLDE